MTEATAGAAPVATKTFRSLSLPAWATVSKENPRQLSIIIEVDSAAAYKDWLLLIKAPAVDQYHVECAYQCIKMDVQRALEGTEFDPQLRIDGKSAGINMNRAPEFQLDKLPKGEGVAKATKGLDARHYYKRIRGSIPFSG